MADEDPELQRRLDLMFGSARPRPGFEEELWHRIEGRRPWWQRLATVSRPALRFAPALAGLLVVVVGGGILLNLRGGGGSSTGVTSSSYSEGGAQPGRPAAFGRLPAPSGGALLPNSAAPAGSAAPALKSTDLAGSAYGFTGQLPVLQPSLPVLRYQEPSPSSLAALAQSQKRRTGLDVKATGSRAETGEEPRFHLIAVAGSPELPTLQATADAFVLGHGLTPSFPFQVTITPGGTSVLYARQFAGPSGPVSQVRSDGTPAGLVLEFRGGAVAAVQGPFDLPLDTSPYPILGPADALAAAGVHSTPVTGPQTVLDTARLVYVAVPSSGYGYFQPMLLLSGSGIRVMVPLVSPEWLRK